MKAISYQFRTEKETGSLLLVYVNSNTRGEKWYEAYDIYGKEHFQADKEFFVRKTLPVKSCKYVQLFNSLISNGRIDKGELTYKLPKP